MLILSLFITFLRIGLFTYGGGYAMIPLLQYEVVASRHWLAMPELVRLVAVAEMTPGPIAVNLATFTGYKVAGLPGALAGTIGVILPSFCLVLVVTKIFLRIRENPRIKGLLIGLRSAILALIISAAVSIGRMAIVDARVIGIAIGCFLVLLWLDLHRALVVIAAGCMGILLLV